MKTILLLFSVVVILFQNCKSQSGKSPKNLFNKDFNWTIELPAGFDSVSEAQWAKMQNKGAEAIEKTYDAKVENRASTIFVFSSDQFNYFESNYQLFDAATDGDFLESVTAVNEMLYGTFETQMPDAKLDSSSSTENIDGKLFRKFNLSISLPNGMLLEMLMYTRLFGKREFTVNILTVDKEKQKILLNAWRNSKFAGE